MTRSRKIEQVVILKSKFGLEERRVPFGVARLLPDRIVLKGWFYKRIIPLEKIQEVRWASDLVVLGLYDGEEIEMIIQSAALWKYELQTRCGLTDSSLNVDKLQEIGSQDAEGLDVDHNDDRAVGDLFDSQHPSNLNKTEIKTENGIDSNEKTPQRESSYRVKTGFAHDRPSKD